MLAVKAVRTLMNTLLSLFSKQISEYGPFCFVLNAWKMSIRMSLSSVALNALKMKYKQHDRCFYPTLKMYRTTHTLSRMFKKKKTNFIFKVRNVNDFWKRRKKLKCLKIEISIQNALILCTPELCRANCFFSFILLHFLSSSFYFSFVFFPLVSSLFKFISYNFHFIFVFILKIQTQIHKKTLAIGGCWGRDVEASHQMHLKAVYVVWVCQCEWYREIKCVNVRVSGARFCKIARACIFFF